MKELTFDEVAILARANGFELNQKDLTDVTHRLNTIISDVENFSHPNLNIVEPVPFRPLEETDNGQ